MLYRLGADFVVILHASFVLFVLLGGFLALKWPRIIWAHLPAAVWGALVELSGWLCPLTPLEQWLRAQGGESGYETDFVAHYLLPIIYPAGLTRGVHVILGFGVLLVNGAVYALLWRRRYYESN